MVVNRIFSKTSIHSRRRWRKGWIIFRGMKNIFTIRQKLMKHFAINIWEKIAANRFNTSASISKLGLFKPPLLFLKRIWYQDINYYHWVDSWKHPNSSMKNKKFWSLKNYFPASTSTQHMSNVSKLVLKMLFILFYSKTRWETKCFLGSCKVMEKESKRWWLNGILYPKVTESTISRCTVT